MSKIDSLIVAIGIELVKAQGFNFQPARSRPVMINFNKDGTFSAESVLKRWSLRPHRSGEFAELQVFGRDDQIYAIFILDQKGVWGGREFANNGPCFLEPICGNVNVWPSLQHIGDFERSAIQLSDEDGFLYREALPPQIDWGPYAFNLADSVKINTLRNKHTAIALCACDRLPYLEKTVQSIALAHSVASYPIFAFVDQPFDVDKTFIQQQAVAVIKKHLPQAIVIKRARNMGCGRNIIDARRQLFDNMGFEQVFVFEDDMIVSPFYLDVCSRMMNVLTSKYTNLASVQGWSECKMSAGIRRQYMHSVSPSMENWWGYLMTKKAWDRMKDFIYRYEEMFLGGNYADRPHESIQSWFRLKLKKREASFGDRPLPEFPSYIAEEEMYLSSIPTGQDGATTVAMLIAGMVKVSATVTRGQNIGEMGISTTPVTFRKFGYDAIHIVDVDTPSLFDEVEVIDKTKETLVDTVTSPGLQYTNLVDNPNEKTHI